MVKPKAVIGNHCHLWTDALHMRELARKSHNKWDRGTYVRMTVNSCWTTIEIACQDALSDDSISYSFRQNLDRAIDNNGFDKLNWGEGIWQRVRELQEIRKSYSHKFLSLSDLFQEVDIAEFAIMVAREAIISIYQHTGSAPPEWADYDTDKGWDSGGRSGASGTLQYKGWDKNDPKAIEISYILHDDEKVIYRLPSGNDYEPYVEKTIKSLNSPAEAVRVYEGGDLVKEITLNLRGS